MVDFVWFHSVVCEGGRFVYRTRRVFVLVRVFALLLLTSAILCAQEYNFRNFGVTEGLSNLAVRQIYQDRVGFIWVSTENGIFRYDGLPVFWTGAGNSVHFGLPSAPAPNESTS